MGAPSMGTAESYNGPSGEIVGESPWFTYADIPGNEDYVVVIEDVQVRKGVKFSGGAANERELFLKFRGIEKSLRVNVTIRRVLDELFTTSCGEWRGKAIALYVQPGIKVGNDVRSGVRVRNRVVSAPAATKQPAAAQPAPAANGWTRAGALKELMEESLRAKVRDALTALAIVVKSPADFAKLPDADLVRIQERIFGNPF